MTHASRTTSPSNLPNPKSSSHTPPADIKPKSSEKLLPPSSKDSSDHSNSTAETPVKKSRPSESSDTPSKSFTFWLAETHLKSSLRPSNLLVQEKTQPRLVQEVLLESKPWTCHQWEESTWPFTCWPTEPESTQWEITRRLLNVWLTRLSTLKRATNNLHTLLRRRKKSRRWPRVTDDLYTLYIHFLHFLFWSMNQSSIEWICIFVLHCFIKWVWNPKKLWMGYK